VVRIADELGIAYRFAYSVTKAAGLLATTHRSPAVTKPLKPSLTVPLLVAGGFNLTSEWKLAPDGALALSHSPPKEPGVYAFVQDDRAQYVGVTLRTMVERMNLYRHGHSSQPTNVVMRQKLIHELTSGSPVAIYTVSPPEGEWNGWPVTTSAGLEVALIRRFALPWNKKGI